MPQNHILQTRQDKINKSLENSYDLIIIGGGITGCGTALDAAARGLSVLLLEKGDFASGTSSKSTKLIHGGLRYLKQFEFALIRETGRERALLHKLAPHLVVSEKMMLPITETGEYGKMFTSLGLGIYDYLAGVKGEDKKKIISVKKAKKKEPLLTTDGLNGAAVYSEYRTDDARLTMANAMTAERYGATCFSYMEVTDILEKKGKVNGVIVEDALTGLSYTYKGRQVVSATGPWVDKVLDIVDDNTEQKLQLTKGVHIVVAKDKLPVSQSIYFEVGDGRMIFAIPRAGVTYIGTTDTFYRKSLNHIEVTAEDADYLLQAVNRAFDTIDLTADDIISSWAGLRPLIYEEGKSPSELSRKDEIFISDNGLISIAGGKLTGYRKMAERMVDLVIKRDKKLERKESSTENIYLHESPLADAAAVVTYRKAVRKIIKDTTKSKVKASMLVHMYGLRADHILENYNDSTETDRDLALTLAELDYCIEYEYVYRPSDFVIRRSGMLYFDPLRLEKYYRDIAQRMSEKLNWDQDEYENQLSKLENMIAESKNFH